MFYKLSLSYYH